MKIDVMLATDRLADIPAAARVAETIGFDAAWTAEAKHDAMLPLPLIAEHTSRMSFGTDIAVAFARSPMNLAYQAWDLAAQSGGRFILGLGTQVKSHIERRFGMPWSPPVPKLREAILGMRAVWDCWQNGQPLDFRGEHYQFTLMTPNFNPGPIDHPKVPVFVAGVNKPLCRLAGEIADGMHGHSFHTEKYLREIVLPAVEEGLAKAGRHREDIEMHSLVFTISNDRERALVRAQIAFYASTPNYRSVLDLHGWGEIGQRLSRLAARGNWDALAVEVSDEMLETIAIVGPDDDLPARLVNRYRGLLDRVQLARLFIPDDDDARWRQLVEGVRACKG